MVAEYIFKSGFSLFRFWVLFTKPEKLDNAHNMYVNGKFVYCIANSVDSAREMIIKDCNELNIACKSVELTQPITTKNSDLKYLSSPSNTLGYSVAVTAKTENAKQVLELMDSVEDGPERYREFVAQVANKANVPTSQVEKELEPFI